MILPYIPSPVQQEFHSLTMDEALIGGAAGPGKSVTLLMDPVEQIVVEHQRKRANNAHASSGAALHIRKEFPRAEETVYRSKIVFPALDHGAKFHEPTHTWTFTSGYRFQFGHLKDNDSFLNYRSKQFTHIAFDELVEIDDPNQYYELVGRVRSSDPVLRKMLKVRAGSNPAPNWVRDYFVVPGGPAGRVVLRRKVKLASGETVERTRIFIPAKLYDNPDPEFVRNYEANLQDKPSHIRRALLDGDWFVVPGAFFANEWRADLHVIKPFKIPSHWRRFRSADWGYKSPCVILWWAITPDEELICYRERTFVQKTAHEVALAIKEIEEERGEWNTTRNCSRLTGPMDTQLWEERGNRGPTMADDMAALGVYWTKASKGRKQAAQQFMVRLKDRGLNERPGVMFFDTCINCIRTIPALGTDDQEPEVPRKGGADHWYDAVSYACAQHVVASKEDGPSVDDDEVEDEVGARRRLGRYGYGAS